MFQTQMNKGVKYQIFIPKNWCFYVITPLLLTGRQLSRLMTKLTEWFVRPAKTQISLGIHLVWSESSLSAWRKLGSLSPHWAHSIDSDQTGRMPRLIWVFAGRTVILLVLSWGGSVSVSVLQSHAFDRNDHRNNLMQICFNANIYTSPVFKNKNCILFIASEYRLIRRDILRQVVRPNKNKCVFQVPRPYPRFLPRP